MLLLILLIIHYYLNPSQTRVLIILKKLVNAQKSHKSESQFSQKHAKNNFYGPRTPKIAIKPLFKDLKPTVRIVILEKLTNSERQFSHYFQKAH